MRVRILLFGLFLLLPASAQALQTASYEFSAGSINAKWAGKGDIKMEQVQGGIILRSGFSTGTFLTSDVPTFFPEGISLYISATKDSDIRFLWSRTANHQASTPIGIPAGNDQPLTFSMRSNNEWHSSLAAIGLILPPQTEVLLSRIDVARWNWPEKIGFAFQSFFVLDEYRPYSINFLWGPLLALNAIEANGVYSTLPPDQLYGTYALNIALLGAFLLLCVLAWKKRGAGMRKAFVIRWFFILALASWLIMDIRMGAEYLSWVINDYRTYVSGTVGTRTFRERDQFYDFAEAVAPFVRDRSSYIFFAEQQWPYLGNMRYITYPAIPGINVESDDTWVIYRRPDIKVQSTGELVMDGLILSAPGEILMDFDDGSFVFRTYSPASPS